jgi:Flp pilus assembly protein TadG
MRRAGERGGAAVELVIVAPLLIAMFLFVVGLGRLGTSREAVDGAARDGAREASIARTSGTAKATADQVVSDTLVEKQITCADRQVNVDFGPDPELTPGGAVHVHVSCRVDNSDAILSGLPGSSTLQGDFVAPVDRYRGVHPDAT